MKATGGKLLAPVLGEQYGEALRSRQARAQVRRRRRFAVWAYDAHKLPICPLTYPLILGHEHAGARPAWRTAFSTCRNGAREMAARALDLKADLAALARDDAARATAIEARVAAFNGDWRELDALIRAQFWRVAFLRVAEDEINYRRFFNINDLAGLRMELAPVFEHAHARVFRMLESGRDRRAADRPYRRAVRPEGLPRGAARACAASHSISLSRRSSRRTNTLRAGLAGRGHDRLRLLNLVAGRARRPVRGSRRSTETYWRLCRRSDEFEDDRARLQAPDHGQRDGERAQRARPRRRAPRPPEPDDGRPHPRHPAARDQAGRRQLPCLSHLSRSCAARRPTPTGATSPGRSRARAAFDPDVHHVRLRFPGGRPVGRRRRRPPARRSAGPRRCASR